MDDPEAIIAVIDELLPESVTRWTLLIRDKQDVPQDWSNYQSPVACAKRGRGYIITLTALQKKM